MFLSRVISSAVVVVLLTAVLICRLVQLQVVDYQRFSELSQDNRLRIEPLAPTRGLILDRNHLVIAENLPIWQLVARSEEHTSELQSRENLVCRLLLEKKKKKVKEHNAH